MQGIAKSTYGFHQLEHLADGDSTIHRLHPMTKTITTFIYVVIVVSFGRYHLTGLLPFLFYPIIIMAISNTPYKPLLQRFLFALPFSVFAGMANVFWDRETALIVGGFTISFGMVSFVVILLKTYLTVMAVLILTATTPMDEIAQQLARLKVPSILVLLLTMIYRYITVALEETINMYTAYKLRAPGEKGIRMGDMGPFVGHLFLRSFDRGERVYAAMKCRGFTGEYSCLSSEKMKLWDWGRILVFLTIALMLRIFDLSIIIGGILA